MAPTMRGVREGSRRFGREVWKPLRRVSGVLWLEFTGVFFGIFAAFALSAVWKLRGAWRSSGVAGGTDHQRFVISFIMLLVFGYFCISSFLRARRRGRGR